MSCSTYTSDDAQITSELLKGKVGKSILTSTRSVYPMKAPIEGIKESAFDPLKHELKIATKENFDYGEGKRQAEAYFFQKSSFDITAVRFQLY